MLPLINIANLLKADSSNLVIVAALGGPDARDRYLQGHLEGALYANLDIDLAAHPDDPAVGGRHPLPTTKVFAKLLTRLGILPETHVVIYDDKNGANSAARLWWMLRSIGHENVQVLDGGLQAAIDSGAKLSTEIPIPKAGEPYPVPTKFSGTADIEEVKIAAHDDSRLVIDVRETPRYLGQTEPLDLIAGHIPGAINVPYLTNLDANGNYLAAEDLASKYKDTLGEVKPADVIVHCGSGVTACHTLLALAQAGIPDAKLYVGSWSEWSRRDLPIGKEERY